MPDDPQAQRVAPPGHSRAAHRAHGFCTACPDRGWWEELNAWRARENALEGERGLPDTAVGPEPGGDPL
ncbi:hypothetical protein PV392_27530 [Streptomyces sp. ME03-5709C]|nr:hypothetical protein [Streptomyces sp. ME03-5709C]